MLDDPAREILAVIRWFGERGKTFNVHFRNIKGRKLDFMEAFPDEGDIDMAHALAAYRDVDYPYMLMPDHVPQIDGRDPSGVAFAYCATAISRPCSTRSRRARDGSRLFYVNLHRFTRVGREAAASFKRREPDESRVPERFQGGSRGACTSRPIHLT